MRLLRLPAIFTRLQAAAMQFGFGTGAEIKGRIARATAGIPTEEGDKLAIFGRSRLATAPLISGTVWVYNPRTDSSVPVPVKLQMSTTNFSLESIPGADLPTLPPGCIIVAATLTGGSTTSPVAQWAILMVFRGGDPTTAITLCRGYIDNDGPVSYPKGTDKRVKIDASVEGAHFVYFATILNDGVTAGDHVYTFTPAAGSRLRLKSGWLLNGDASGRVLTVTIIVGGDVVAHLVTNGTAPSATVAAGATQGIPAASLSAASGFSNMQPDGITIPDGATLVVTLAAVAVSQDSALRIGFDVWGEAPTVTETAPAGATITIEQELVLAG